MSVFPLVKGVTKRSLCLVHPQKQIVVSKLLGEFKNDEINLVVFGSAMTCSCSIYSDLDISIETPVYDNKLFMEYFHRAIMLSDDNGMDIVWFNQATRSNLGLAKNIMGGLHYIKNWKGGLLYPDVWPIPKSGSCLYVGESTSKAVYR